MKKFEVTFSGSRYDYVTAKIILEYIQSSFPKALVAVKTIPQKKTSAKPEKEDLIYEQ